nr:MAG TPA: hypothetical protein [Caudoviricetes sp.]
MLSIVISVPYKDNTLFCQLVYRTSREGEYIGVYNSPSIY